MAKIRKTPKIILYVFGFTVINPPKNANGTEVMIKGSKSLNLKCPFRVNENSAIDETKIFKIRAEGLMNSGEKLNMAIKARYPLAPPCPTEEYRTAIRNTNPGKRISVIYYTLNF